MPATNLVDHLVEVAVRTRAERRYTALELVDAQEHVQREANRLARAGDTGGARELLLAAARGVNAAYPQYDGYWDDYVLGEIVRGFTLKGGRRIPSGDVVLVARADKLSAGEWLRPFHCVRWGINILSDTKYVRHGIL